MIMLIARPNSKTFSGGPAPTFVTPRGKLIRSSAIPAAKLPIPEVALAVNAIADEKSPYWRFPVRSSLSSTVSAIIDETSIPIATTAITIRNECPIRIGSRAG